MNILTVLHLFIRPLDGHTGILNLDTKDNKVLSSKTKISSCWIGIKWNLICWCLPTYIYYMSKNSFPFLWDWYLVIKMYKTSWSYSTYFCIKSFRVGLLRKRYTTIFKHPCIYWICDNESGRVRWRLIIASLKHEKIKYAGRALHDRSRDKLNLNPWS